MHKPWFVKERIKLNVLKCRLSFWVVLKQNMGTMLDNRCM